MTPRAEAVAHPEITAPPTGSFIVRAGPFGKWVNLVGSVETGAEAELLAKRHSERHQLWTVVLEGEWQLYGDPPKVWGFSRRRTICLFTPQGVRQ